MPKIIRKEVAKVYRVRKVKTFGDRVKSAAETVAGVLLVFGIMALIVNLT